MALRAAIGEIQCVLANVRVGFALFSTTNFQHTEVFCQEIQVPQTPFNLPTFAEKLVFVAAVKTGN